MKEQGKRGKSGVICVPEEKFYDGNLFPNTSGMSMRSMRGKCASFVKRTLLIHILQSTGGLVKRKVPEAKWN